MMEVTNSNLWLFACALLFAMVASKGVHCTVRVLSIKASVTPCVLVSVQRRATRTRVSMAAPASIIGTPPDTTIAIVTGTSPATTVNIMVRKITFLLFV
ncbi:unnamed protein product [Lampetra fluviatilis]